MSADPRVAAWAARPIRDRLYTYHTAKKQATALVDAMAMGNELQLHTHFSFALNAVRAEIEAIEKSFEIPPSGPSVPPCLGVPDPQTYYPNAMSAK